VNYNDLFQHYPHTYTTDAVTNEDTSSWDEVYGDFLWGRLEEASASERFAYGAQNARCDGKIVLHNRLTTLTILDRFLDMGTQIVYALSGPPILTKTETILVVYRQDDM
jgi:hypothetical protein